ncbi:MAG TPA: hypothetical protein VGA22_06365 [Gemmatimonadales bacterium]
MAQSCGSSLALSAAALAVASLVAAGCADPPTAGNEDVLAGLEAVSTNDSGPTQPIDGPGSFRGGVMGYDPGPDTLDTTVRLPNVQVTVYTRVDSEGDAVGVGPEVVSVLTDENGEFQTPELPGGEYVVTFMPPADSRYSGGWTIGVAHPESNQHPWWIMLPAK